MALGAEWPGEGGGGEQLRATPRRASAVGLVLPTGAGAVVRVAPAGKTVQKNLKKKVEKEGTSFSSHSQTQHSNCLYIELDCLKGKVVSD
jgi:subtilisin family serine protease